MSNIIDGKLVSAAVKDRVANEVKELNTKGVDVCLAVILVGADPASQIKSDAIRVEFLAYRV